jgi:hypothetical protein
VTLAAVPVHVALVDTTGTIAASDLAEVAGALNEQVQADFAPAWHVAATVGAYPAAPPATWRIDLVHGTSGGTLGFHADANHQPFAKVGVDAGSWTVTASHELLEMLGDPWGNRLHSAAAPPGWAGTTRRVRYLLELCDPCETLTYTVGGVEVSDFLTPAFYRSSRRDAAGYSHTGRVTSPLEVAEGGYITFLDPADGHFWQRHVRGGAAEDHDWGVQDMGHEMLRERADGLARQIRG